MSSSNCTIRVATRADATEVADVYLASRRELLAFAPLTHPESEVRQWLADTVVATGRVLIAEVAQRVVGLLAWSSRRLPAGDVFWIDHLYLRPADTGQGIGTMLLAEALRRCGRPVRAYTFLQNLGARRFYERHGFVAIRFSDGRDNEEGCADVLFELCR